MIDTGMDMMLHHFVYSGMSLFVWCLCVLKYPSGSNDATSFMSLSFLSCTCIMFVAYLFCLVQ